MFSSRCLVLYYVCLTLSGVLCYTWSLLYSLVLDLSGRDQDAYALIFYHMLVLTFKDIWLKQLVINGLRFELSSEKYTCMGKILFCFVY